jgi:hypothetical protein
MTDILISKYTEGAISQDGRNIVLTFQVQDGSKASLHLTALELEKLMHDLSFLITKARELSELSKQGIVSILRPSKASANLLSDNRTVVLSFQIRAGLELHYGFESTVAIELNDQIKEVVQQGIETGPQRGH